jgi:mRNA-degrading endonuclease HigB of HigAB toxin-antitoxin module
MTPIGANASSKSAVMPLGGLKLYLNGHEWLKRQSTKEGIGFESLDNGFLSCQNPQRLQAVVVFNIGGGAFCLITAIHYNRGIVYIRKFLTHAEYSKEEWKNDP